MAQNWEWLARNTKTTFMINYGSLDAWEGGEEDHCKLIRSTNRCSNNKQEISAGNVEHSYLYNPFYASDTYCAISAPQGKCYAAAVMYTIHWIGVIMFLPALFLIYKIVTNLFTVYSVLYIILLLLLWVITSAVSLRIYH